jgi:hypothetical protein
MEKATRYAFSVALRDLLTISAQLLRLQDVALQEVAVFDGEDFVRWE